MRALHSLVLLVAFAGCASKTVQRPDGQSGLLPVGATAPELTAEAADGTAVKLSSLSGKPVVVYFYPKDGTPGCTKEACAFRDVWTRYQSAGVAVIGVSQDSVERHRKFAADHHLPFPLVSDPKAEAQKSYGVPNNMFGWASRVSFLVGPDGRVAHVWPDVDPGVHAAEVLAVAVPLVRAPAQ